MKKAQREAIRQAIMESKTDSVIAGMLKTEEEWSYYYDRFLDKLQDLRDKGMRIGEVPAMSDFAKQWAHGYKSGDPDFRKNPMRHILESQKKVSKAQAEAWKEGFTPESVEKFLQEQQRLTKEFAEWKGVEENRGKLYEKPTGIKLTEEQEQALKNIADLGPRNIRTTKFLNEYNKVKDVMKEYYKTIAKDQRKTNRNEKSGSWFYEIWYLD